MGWLTEAFRTGTAIYEPTGISGYATLAAYLVLPVLLMVTQFIMQKYMTPTPPSADSQVKTTQQITLIMTFMFGFFTLQVPAGLTLYWVTSNLLQMGQTWFMMRRTPVLETVPAVVDSTASIVDGDKTAPSKAVASKQNAGKQSSKTNTKALPAPAAGKRVDKPVTEKATTITASTAKAKNSPSAANTTTLKTTTLKTTANPADLSSGSSTPDTSNAPEGKGATS
jgi:hypothetical protein